MSSSSWSRWWNRSRVPHPRPRSPKPRRACLAVESLEDRSLFSANGVGSVLQTSLAVVPDDTGAAPSPAAHARPVSFTFQDINGDGIPDLAITNLRTNTTLVFLSQEPGRWALDLSSKTTVNPTWAGSFDLQLCDGTDAPVILIVNRVSERTSMLVGYQQNSLLAPDPFSEPMWDGLLLVGSLHPSDRLLVDNTAILAEAEDSAADHGVRAEHEAKVVDLRLDRPVTPAEPDPSTDPGSNGASTGFGSSPTERRDGPVSSRIASGADDTDPAAPENNGSADRRATLAAPVDLPAATFPLALERSLPSPQPALESLEESNGAVVATLLVESPSVPPPSLFEVTAGEERALPHFVIGADDAPRGSVVADQWSTLPPVLQLADVGATGQAASPDAPQPPLPSDVGSTDCREEPPAPVHDESAAEGRVLEPVVPPPVVPDDPATGPVEPRTTEGPSTGMTPALEAVFALGLWATTRYDRETRDSPKRSAAALLRRAPRTFSESGT